MRAVWLIAAAWDRFLLGVFEGVGSMVIGSMVGGASEVEGPASESECVVVFVEGLACDCDCDCEWEAVLRGVL